MRRHERGRASLLQRNFDALFTQLCSVAGLVSSRSPTWRWWHVMIGAAAAVALGAAIGLFSGQGVWRTAGRQLLATVIAASVTYGVGHLIGAGARAS